MPRRHGPRHPYLKRYTCWCVWCGEAFESAHRDAQTCGMKCRSRLHRFAKKTGFPPEEPVGNVTAETAYQELLAKLLDDERDRRRTIQALMTGGGGAMFAAVEQIAANMAAAKKTG